MIHLLILAIILTILGISFLYQTNKIAKNRESELNRINRERIIIEEEIQQYRRAFMAMKEKGNIQNELMNEEADIIIDQLSKGKLFPQFTEDGILKINEVQIYLEKRFLDLRHKLVSDAEYKGILPPPNVLIQDAASPFAAK